MNRGKAYHDLMVEFIENNVWIDRLDTAVTTQEKIQNWEVNKAAVTYKKAQSSPWQVELIHKPSTSSPLFYKRIAYRCETQKLARILAGYLVKVNQVKYSVPNNNETDETSSPTICLN